MRSAGSQPQAACPSALSGRTRSGKVSMRSTILSRRSGVYPRVGRPADRQPTPRPPSPTPLPFPRQRLESGGGDFMWLSRGVWWARGSMKCAHGCATDQCRLGAGASPPPAAALTSMAGEGGARGQAGHCQMAPPPLAHLGGRATPLAPRCWCPPPRLAGLPPSPPAGRYRRAAREAVAAVC